MTLYALPKSDPFPQDRPRSIGEPLVMDTRLEDLTAFAQCVKRVAQVGPITHVDGVPDIRIGTLAGNLDFLAREAANVLAKVTAVEIALDEQQVRSKRSKRSCVYCHAAGPTHEGGLCINYGENPNGYGSSVFTPEVIAEQERRNILKSLETDALNLRSVVIAPSAEQADEEQEAAEQEQRDLDGPSDAAIERMRDAGGRSSFYEQNMRDAGRGHLL